MSVRRVIRAQEKVSGSPLDDKINRDGPIVVWKYDETSGTTMADASGHGRGGDISGAQLGIPGLLDDGGTAMLFPWYAAIWGTGPDVGSVSGGWTAEAVFKLTDAGQNFGQGRTIFAALATNGYSDGLFVESWGATPRIWAAFSGAGGGLATTSHVNVSVGQAHHAVARFDGGRTGHLFLDGALIATIDTASAGAPSPATQIYAGARSDFAMPTLVLDTCAFYTHPLTDVQIYEHWLATGLAS